MPTAQQLEQLTIVHAKILGELRDAVGNGVAGQTLNEYLNNPLHPLGEAFRRLHPSIRNLNPAFLDPTSFHFPAYMTVLGALIDREIVPLGKAREAGADQGLTTRDWAPYSKLALARASEFAIDEYMAECARIDPSFAQPAFLPTPALKPAAAITSLDMLEVIAATPELKAAAEADGYSFLLSASPGKEGGRLVASQSEISAWFSRGLQDRRLSFVELYAVGPLEQRVGPALSDFIQHQVPVGVRQFLRAYTAAMIHENSADYPAEAKQPTFPVAYADGTVFLADLTHPSFANSFAQTVRYEYPRNLTEVKGTKIRVSRSGDSLDFQVEDALHGTTLAKYCGTGAAGLQFYDAQGRAQERLPLKTILFPPLPALEMFDKDVEQQLDGSYKLGVQIRSIGQRNLGRMRARKIGQIYLETLYQLDKKRELTPKDRRMLIAEVNYEAA